MITLLWWVVAFLAEFLPARYIPSCANDISKHRYLPNQSEQDTWKNASIIIFTEYKYFLEWFDNM